MGKFQAFEPVSLEWEGKTYTIPAKRVFGAILRIEEHVLLVELQGIENNRVPIAKLAGAFKALLDYAGCSDVDVEEIYAKMLTGDTQAASGIRTLIGIMFPRKQLEHAVLMKEEERKAAEIAAPGKLLVDAPLLSNATDSPSARNGFRRRRSGRSRR